MRWVLFPFLAVYLACCGLVQAAEWIGQCYKELR
jgi:hypothetical protein